MPDAFVTSLVAVLAFSLGIFASHATLGNKLTGLIEQVKPMTKSIDDHSHRIARLERVHYHRRATDEVSPE